MFKVGVEIGSNSSNAVYASFTKWHGAVLPENLFYKLKRTLQGIANEGRVRVPKEVLERALQLQVPLDGEQGFSLSSSTVTLPERHVLTDPDADPISPSTSSSTFPNTCTQRIGNALDLYERWIHTMRLRATHGRVEYDESTPTVVL